MFNPAIVLSMFMLSFIFVCGLFEWKWICAGFCIICLCVYYCWRSSYKKGRIGIQL